CAAKMATFPVSGSVRFLPQGYASRRDVGERRCYEKKRAIAEGRVKAARVRSMRRGTARLRFA
ncbi:MAG: hypothetical protein IJC66_11690, partial [Kiritimatiellae bacterium]|nr:hypothetical protein [Kiritimatiellia bacterium]